MKEMFKGFYSPEKKDFTEMWTEGVFIFDTNVLLNLYRYPESVRTDFAKVIEKLQGRVWLPFHVALEFQRNRNVEISNQKTRFKDVEKIVDTAYTSTKKDLDNLYLKKRHSKIDPDPFLNELNKLVTKFKEQLVELQSEQPSITEKDSIRELIDKLFNNKVGSPPSSQKDIDEIIKEGEKRYKALIPPGYKDASKGSESFTYGGVTYPNKFGDLIVWKQIIEHAKENSIKNVILVTDDNKEDWWWFCKEGANKKLGPRPELISEITAEADVSNFYLYNSERFLQFSADYLATEVSEESVTQVRDITRVSNDPIEFIGDNVSQWGALLQFMFHGKTPTSFRWDNLEDIVKILNLLGKHGNISHVFMPNGGGLDITGAKVAGEVGCIEIEFQGSSSIVKPISLSLETFEGNTKWSYFRLDTGGLAESGIYDTTTGEDEALTQLEPGNYLSYDVWSAGHHGVDEDGYEIPLPSTARPVTRHFRGAFVIFAKGSIYNQTSSTYDARHNKMDTESFKKYIAEAIAQTES
jgi:hypothetical protein